MIADFVRSFAASTAELGSLHPLSVVLTVVFVQGLIRVAGLLRGAAGFVYRQLVPGVNVSSLGEWAVVTGATSGIGFGVAKELASRGMSVVLVSRSAASLAERAKEIGSRYPRVTVRTIQADFTADADELEATYARVSEGLRGLSVGVLYNNAGVSYDHAEYLTDVGDEQVARLVDVNVNATTQMTRIVLPGMVERGRGAVVNVASAAGVIPVGDPLYAVYSATKAYVDFFSRSLHYEVASKGVIVQCQVPYFVVSKMSKIRRASLTVPTPETFARCAVSAIGHGATVVPFWAHAVQHTFMCALPEWLLARLVLGHHHSIRKRALAKKAKKQ